MVNRVVYEPRITAPAFEGHGLFPFVFWRSLAIGDYNKNKGVWHAHSVWSAIRQGIRSVNGYLQEKGVSRIYWLSVLDFHIAGNQITFIIY
ncbi:MAG: hypothetical protein NZ937_08150 [Armatimonadetes bacterium]|nr:hypothetical protein [Armatimonadota bacterium]